MYQGQEHTIPPYFFAEIVAYSIKIRKNIKKRGRKSPPFFRFKTPKPKDIKFGRLTTVILGGVPYRQHLTAC